MALDNPPTSTGTRADARRRRLAMWVLAAAMTAAGLALLWWILAAAISSDRGLDVTDEGIYLLAADPPSSTAAFLFPWGWHTQPLFRLAGYDIAYFRTASALLLVVAAGLMAAAGAWFARRGSGRSREPGTHGLVIAGVLVESAGVVAVAMAALVLYTSLLRGPGYYWVNLVGLLITCGAVAALATRLRGRAGLGHPWTAHALAAAAAFGLFFAIPAKPSSPVLVALASLCFLAVVLGPRRAVRWLVEIALLTVAWVVVAVAVRVWPLDAVVVFRRQLGLPLEAAQTAPVALGNAVRVPATFLAQLVHWPDVRALALVAGGLLALLASWKAGRHWRLWVLGGFAAVLAGCVVLMLSNPGTSDFARAIYAPITTASLIVVAAALIAAVRSAASEGQGWWSGSTGLRPVVALAAFFTVMPFVFAFGTYNGTYPMASLAIVFPVAAAATLLLTVASVWLRASAMAALLVAVGVVVTMTLVRSGEHPYRQVAIGEQSAPVEVGAHGATLLLDPTRAQGLAALRSQATAAGWRTGTPVVDLSWGTHAGVVFALGARAPESLIPGLMDATPGSLPRFRYLLSTPYRAFPFADAWILSSDADVLDATARPVIGAAAGALAEVSGRTFPADYTCVASAPSMTNDPEDRLTLWRPGRPDASAVRNDAAQADPYACAVPG